MLKYALHRRPEDVPGPMTQEQWQQLFAMAQEHKLLPLFYESAFGIASLAGTPLPASTRQLVLGQVMEQTVKTQEFLELYKALSQRGFTPLVVKGILCRNLYPTPDLRPSSDEDLLVLPGQFQEIQAQLQSLGLTPVNWQEDEVSFRRPGSPLHIELHRQLFPTNQQAYGHLNQYFQRIIHHSTTAQFQGVALSVPEPTDHLLYMVCHNLKHFLHSGFGIRQVCDLLLFTQAHSLELDWDRFTSTCMEIHCQVFTSALYRIGVRHLGFDYQSLGLPEVFQNLPVDELPLLEDILEGGIYGGSSPARQRSSNITLNAASGNVKKSPLAASLFPGVSQLQNRYPYLKKYPWLLPVAWGSRIVHYAKDLPNARESLSLGTQRLTLLEKYDLIEKH